MVNDDQQLVGILAIIGLAETLSEDARNAAVEVIREIGQRTLVSSVAPSLADKAEPA